MEPVTILPLIALCVSLVTLGVCLWANKEVRQAMRQIEHPDFGSTKESPDA